MTAACPKLVVGRVFKTKEREKRTPKVDLRDEEMRNIMPTQWIAVR